MPHQDPIQQARLLIARAAPDLNFAELPVPDPLPPIEYGVYYLQQPLAAQDWIRDAVERQATQVYVQIGQSTLPGLLSYTQTNISVLMKYLPGIHPLVFGNLLPPQLPWANALAENHATCTRLSYIEYCKMLRGADSR